MQLGKALVSGRDNPWSSLSVPLLDWDRLRPPDAVVAASMGPSLGGGARLVEKHQPAESDEKAHHADHGDCDKETLHPVHRKALVARSSGPSICSENTGAARVLSAWGLEGGREQIGRGFILAGIVGDPHSHR